MSKVNYGDVVKVWNKGKSILQGTYVKTECGKADTYLVDITDVKGNKKTLTKTVDKKELTELSSQGFNTNVRNYVAGVAREKKGSKLSAYEQFFAEQGIDTKGIPVDKLIEKLKDFTK